MEVSAFTLVLPVVGVIVGAVLQYWLTRHARSREVLLESRVKAYADFIAATARLARTPKNDKQLRRSLLGERGDAKYRICIYGSTEVVTALAGFEGSETGTSGTELRRRFLELCRAMRADSGSGESVTLDMGTAIYGSPPLAQTESNTPL